MSANKCKKIATVVTGIYMIIMIFLFTVELQFRQWGGFDIQEWLLAILNMLCILMSYFIVMECKEVKKYYVGKMTLIVLVIISFLVFLMLFGGWWRFQWILVFYVPGILFGLIGISAERYRYAGIKKTLLLLLTSVITILYIVFLTMVYVGYGVTRPIHIFSANVLQILLAASLACIAILKFSIPYASKEDSCTKPMIQCTKCGEINSADNAFCIKCGCPMEKK